jgi:hypothetical protein
LEGFTEYLSLLDITLHSLPLITEHSLPVFQSKVYQSEVGEIDYFSRKFTTNLI